MQEQRDRAKADARAKKGAHRDADGVPRGRGRAWARRSSSPATPRWSATARSRGLVTADGVVDSVREGDEVELVLDRTPFYAEGGGQLADQGVIELSNGARLRVDDVQSPITGLIVHQATVLNGEVTPGLEAHSLVDLERRLSISRAHTATHMVHKAFREALGETATQAGSENAPGRFRFDFSAAGAVPGVGDGRRRGAGQRRDPRRPRRARRGDEPGRGGQVRRDGAVRREVRRPGARGLGRRLGPRAVRRHPRRQLGQARRDQAARRVVASAPAYAGSRRWSAPTPTGSWPASTCWSPSSPRRSRRAPRSCPSGSTTSSRSCAPPRRSSRRSGSASCWPGPASWRPRAEQVGGVARGGDAARPAPVAATCARSRSTCAAGCPRASPGSWSSSARATGRRQGLGRGRGQRRGPRPRPERQRAGPRGRPAGRRQGRRQGRRRPGRRHRRLPDRRGARAGPRRGRQGGSQLEARRPARPRPRRRPDRGGAQRPVRVPGDAGRDGPARPRRPGPDRGAARRGAGRGPGAGARGGRRAAPLAVRGRGSGGREGARVGASSWPGRWRRCRCGSPTSGSPP